MENNQHGRVLLDIRALTISPGIFVDDKESLLVEYNKWLKRLAKLNNRFVLYPELVISEEGIRLHWHGIIYVDDPFGYVEDIRYLKSICFICEKPIHNLNKWLKYCKKEISKTKQTLGLKRNKTLPITENSDKIKELRYEMSREHIMNLYWKKYEVNSTI